MNTNLRPEAQRYRLLLWKVRNRMHRVRRSLLAHWTPPSGTIPENWEQSFPTNGSAGAWSHRGADRSGSLLHADDEWRQLSREAREKYPHLVQSVCTAADRAVALGVRILGKGVVTIPSDYDWCRDPISGRVWPQHRSEWVPIVLDDRDSDIKHLWEIARFQFAPSLGLAGRITGDRRYADSLRGWIESFLDHNPFGTGPHWTNPMEAAIRAVNWMIAWTACPAPIGDEEFTRRLTGSLVEHGRFIARNLECTHRGINTNHYLADLVGLYAIAVFLPEWPEAQGWRALAHDELCAEAMVQIHEDGFCYESSFGYHRLAFEMLMLHWRLASRNGESRVAEIAGCLKRMAAFSLWNADRHGRLPAVGDADDGRFLTWEDRGRDDHTPVWDCAEAAFGPIDAPHPDPRSNPVSADVFWLLGADAYERLCEERALRHGVQPPPGRDTRCRLFPHAQIAVLRSRRWLVHALANPVGTGGIGGHKHNDMLSFTASCDGTPIIIDPGTYAYTADPHLRNLMRRTEAHAVVTVDGEEQNRMAPGQLFYLHADGAPEITLFAHDARSARVVMRHDAYGRLPDPVLVTRTIDLNRGAETLTVTDSLLGTADHDLAVILPLGNCGIRITGLQTVVLTTRDGREFSLSMNTNEDWHMELETGWRSDAYGDKRGHRRLIFRSRITLPTSWSITLAPVAVADGPPIHTRTVNRLAERENRRVSLYEGKQADA